MSILSDNEWHFIDGSYVKSHQHSAGAAGQRDQAIGKSRGGNTSKIHMVVDAHGLPVAFEITGVEVSDYTVAPDLINSIPVIQTLIADKGYDSELIRECVRAKGAIPIYSKGVEF